MEVIREDFSDYGSFAFFEFADVEEDEHGD